MASLHVVIACLALGLCSGTSVPPSAFHAAPLVRGWRVLSDKVHDDHSLTLMISMKQRNLDVLRRTAQEVSDPRHARYGQHMTSAEIRALTRPSTEDVNAVMTWLSGAGAQVISRRGDEVLEATLSASAATSLLQTTFRHLKNDKTGQRVVRSGAYWLPGSVDAAVTSIYGLHGLPLPRKNKIQDFTTPANVTPAVLQQTYNITGISAQGSAKNRQAVAEFQGQTMNASDLTQFFEQYVPGSSASKVSKFVGDAGVGVSGDEAMLDIEYIMGIAPSLLTEFWYWGGNDFCSDLKNWTGAILAEDDAPLVHSVSYGYQGDMKELGCKDSDVQDVDANFAKLAAKGISVIISSGDSGSGYPNLLCSNDDCGGGVNDTAVQGDVVIHFPLPKNTDLDSPLGCCATCELFGEAGDCDAWTYDSLGPLGGLCTVYKNVTGTTTARGRVSGGNVVKPPPLKLFNAWPSSSPWVTSVGATRFHNQMVGQPQIATDQFGSGGGFSWDFDTFNDQAAAVKAYLATAPQLPPAAAFPPLGRATPDVSVLGEGFQIILNGTVMSIGGTSASAPSFAGMISLLNEARLGAGKSPMGYLNPFLYQNPDAFTDVIEGTNAIGRGPFTLEYGFNCTKGWDPVTGLGTPKFDKMLAAALNDHVSISSLEVVV